MTNQIPVPPGGSNLAAWLLAPGQVVAPQAGMSSAASAPILTAVAGASTVATQLSDTTRDYMVYLQVGTAGTLFIVTMGHTSGASDVTLHASGAGISSEVISFRLPAGWWFLWSGTLTTITQSVAVGC